MLLKDCNQISKDSKRRHTLLVSELEGQEPMLDLRVDNEVLPETFAAENVGTKEMKLAVLSWERMDIFLSHDDANDEDDC